MDSDGRFGALMHIPYHAHKKAQEINSQERSIKMRLKVKCSIMAVIYQKISVLAHCNYIFETDGVIYLDRFRFGLVLPHLVELHFSTPLFLEKLMA